MTKRGCQQISANAASVTELEQHVTLMPAACQYMINADCIIAHEIQQAQQA
jgi:hypothetical protein